MPWASSRSSWIVSCTSPAKLVEHFGAGGRIVSDDVARQAQVHGERHQMLLRPVVQVPFDPPPLGVTTGHNAGPGFAQGICLLAQFVQGGLECRVEL